MKQKKILIADDETFTACVLECCIQKMGHTVIMAYNGQQALDKIVNSNGNSIDLLITDIQMPEMTGIDLIRNLKLLKIDLPIMVMTGSSDTNIFEELKELGIKDVFKKPIASSGLIEKIAELP